LLTGIVEPPHHRRSDHRQGEFRTLLFRKIHYANAELLERAAIVRGRLHGANLYHRLLVSEFAAYRAAAQKSDLVRFHCLFSLKTNLSLFAGLFPWSSATFSPSLSVQSATMNARFSIYRLMP
jgi:hypothetical protein